MKKELFLPLVPAIFIFAIVSSSCFSSLVLAESPTSAQERLNNLRQKREHLISVQDQRLDRLDKRQEKKIEIGEKLATRDAQLQAKVVSRVKKVFTNILNRFKAALARLDKIAQRIASRIDKLKANGVNTAGAEAALTAAEQKGAAAAVAIDNAKAQIGAIDSSSSVKDAVHAAVNSVRDAKRALQDYHRALADTMRQLKAAKALREGTESAH